MNIHGKVKDEKEKIISWSSFKEVGWLKESEREKERCLTISNVGSKSMNVSAGCILLVRHVWCVNAPSESFFSYINQRPGYGKATTASIARDQLGILHNSASREAQDRTKVPMNNKSEWKYGMSLAMMNLRYCFAADDDDWIRFSHMFWGKR